MKLKPEERALKDTRSKLAALADDLAGKELELRGFEDELKRFQYEYHDRLGALFVELDSAQAAHLEAQVRANPNDQELRERAQQARAKAEQGQSTHAQQANEVEPPPPASKELKDLQRKMVMENHPDKGKTEEDIEKRTQRMARINAAYQKRDLDELQRLEEEFGSDPDAVEGDDVGANWVRAIRAIEKIEQKIKEIDAEIEALKESHWWKLFVQIQEERDKGRAPLDAMAARLRADIDALQSSPAS